MRWEDQECVDSRANAVQGRPGHNLVEASGDRDGPGAAETDAGVGGTRRAILRCHGARFAPGCRWVALGAPPFPRGLLALGWKMLSMTFLKSSRWLLDSARDTPWCNW